MQLTAPFIRNKMESVGLQVADHVSAMLAYWDKDLVCRFANTAYRAWFGKTPEEMIGKITIKELLGPLYEKNLPFILGALEGRPQVFEREIPTPSGIRHSLASYFPDVADGVVKGFFVHVADITPLKMLEKELLQSNQMVTEQNKRLMSFANIVSHNLKSYANNFKSILDFYLTARSDEERTQMINYLRDISGGFSETVNHLNDIVKIQSHAGLTFESIALRDYIERSIDILRVQIRSSNAVIFNNVNASVKIWANHAYVESILLNLLTNAMKYRHPVRSPVIEIYASFRNETWQLKIKDNGLGIDLKKYGKDLFGLYKTFHGNPDAQGIGLYITKLQVEAMGGQIVVESEENEGTVFTVYFQRAANRHQ